jgi:hypothetical protein
VKGAYTVALVFYVIGVGIASYFVWCRVENLSLNYVATRPLAKNALLVADDLEAPAKLPRGATKRLPGKEGLVGKYLREEVSKSQAITADKVAAQPLVERGQAECLLTADLGAYEGVSDMLPLGGEVSITCHSSRFDACAATGPATLVALLPSATHERRKVLLSAAPAACARVTAVVVSSLPIPKTVQTQSAPDSTKRR